MQVEGHHAAGLPAVVATGARVSNAYPTIRGPGDSLPKGGLIPGGVRGFHGRLTKGFVRPATGMRSISLTAPTLGLRHGPDSYGRQQ